MSFLNRKVSIFLCFLSVTIFVDKALAAEAEDSAHLLLNVEYNGILRARGLEFTNLETQESVRIMGVDGVGMRSQQRFILETIPSGEYHLSAIFPIYNGNDSGPPIRLDEGSGVIKLFAGAINYIGDLTITTRGTGQRIDTAIGYEAKSDTLMAAVSSHRELFSSLPVLITIADNPPLRIDPGMLGL